MIDNNEFEKNLIRDDQPEFEDVAKEPRVIVHKIYTKGQQFIVNGFPDDLSKNWAPQLNMQANPRFTLLEPKKSEVVLTLNLSAQQLGKSIFQIQLDQAGLFTLQDVSRDQQEIALYGACPNVLFPYAVVMVNQALSQAGLPHVYLNPLDFVALYHEHKKQQKITGKEVQEDEIRH